MRCASGLVMLQDACSSTAMSPRVPDSPTEVPAINIVGGQQISSRNGSVKKCRQRLQLSELSDVQE